MGAREVLGFALTDRGTFQAFRSQLRRPRGEMEIVEGLLEAEEQLDHIGDRLEALLQIDPLNPNLHQWSFAYWSFRGDHEKATLHGLVLRALTEWFETEGDGRSAETAYVIDSVAEEYLIVQRFGRRVLQQGLTRVDQKPYDVLTCIDGDGVTHEVWFDVSRCFRRYLASEPPWLAGKRGTKYGLAHPCPACGSGSVARILYGLVPSSDELSGEIERGDVYLGGHMPEANMWHCNACANQWHD
jgi:hypothetical protein